MENSNNFEIVKSKKNIQKVIAFKDVLFDLETLIKEANDLARVHLLKKLSDKLYTEGYGRLEIVTADTTNNNIQDWNQNGIEVAILDPEIKGWQKGKARLRMVLEFCPDSISEHSSTENSTLPDTSLETIRQNIS